MACAAVTASWPIVFGGCTGGTAAELDILPEFSARQRVFGSSLPTVVTFAVTHHTQLWFSHYEPPLSAGLAALHAGDRRGPGRDATPGAPGPRARGGRLRVRVDSSRDSFPGTTVTSIMYIIE